MPGYLLIQLERCNGHAPALSQQACYRACHSGPTEQHPNNARGLGLNSLAACAGSRIGRLAEASTKSLVDALPKKLAPIHTKYFDAGDFFFFFV